MRNIGILTMALAALLLSEATAEAMSLKQTAIVKSNILTLGDIFDDLPHSADKVLGAAPAPGEDMVLRSTTLLRVAMALDLPWRPVSSNDYTVIKRAATIIQDSDIQNKIHDALQAELGDGLYDLQFTAPAPRIILPEDQEPAFEVIHVSLNDQQNSFEANIAAPSRERPLVTKTVHGTIQKKIEIPVLITPLSRGSVISANDIEMITIPANRIQGGMVLNDQTLIGKETRRTINARTPVKNVDVMEPLAVKRGDLVTLTYQSGPLVLTTQAKALQNGSRGETIRVVNTASNKTLEGRVTGDDAVSVQQF